MTEWAYIPSHATVPLMTTLSFILLRSYCLRAEKCILIRAYLKPRRKNTSCLEFNMTHNQNSFMIMYNYDDIQTQPSAALLSLLNRKPDHDNSINRIFRCKKIHPKNWNSPTVKSLLFLQDLRGINILRA